MQPQVSTAGADQDLGRRVEELKRELSEAHQRERVTAEVLKLIGRSPSHLQTVFDAVVRNAATLCGSLFANVFRFDGELLHLEASSSLIPKFLQMLQKRYPMPPDVSQVSGRVVLSRDVVRIEDAYQDAQYDTKLAVSGEWRRMLGVPMLLEGKPVGALVVGWAESGPIPNFQEDLLRTFAEQAVIAIENTRLFAAEQASKRELEESLEYQTATSEVLSVISKSPQDVQPVMDMIAKTARRLCAAEFANIYLKDGETFLCRWRDDGLAHQGPAGEVMDTAPLAPGRDSMTGRAALQGTAVHVIDVAADPDMTFFSDRGVEVRRTALAVPLLRHDEVIGVINVGRTEKRPFTDRQIGLVTTFADQAVIAIENTRLFEEVQARTRELTEALEQQTATADVLKIISRSTFDLQPVLEILLENATRLCSAESGLIWNFDDGVFRATAAYGVPTELIDFWDQNPIRPGRGSVTGRAALERRTVQIPDALADPEYQLAASQKLGGYRTLLGVPMFREGDLIGVFGLQRYQVKPFTDKQIELVTTFADQAVIAIENVRLFEQVRARTRDLTRSVAELKALGAVGQAVSSTLDLNVVLARILEHACTMSDAGGGAIYAFDKVRGQFDLEAAYNMREEHIVAVREHPIRFGESLVGQCAEQRQALQIDDLTEVPTHPLYEMHLKGGVRALLAVPLLNHQDDVIGALIVRRMHAGVFTAETVDLLQTFANQSAIALENARLFEEIAQKSRELEIASQHKSQFVANMSHELRTPLAAILGYAELMQEGFYGSLSEKSTDALTRIRSNGKHLLGLINTVLDIAKIESGQFSLNIGEYAIESMVETVRSATESLAETKKLSLKTDVAKKLPIGLGDEQRLTQVLLNLVGNAIKFTDTGEVRITATAMIGHFTIAVTDTGPGIPAEELKRVFEQFHQIDNSNTKAKGGTGLGLAIAKQIVELHGGRIWVESTLGQGATFQMQLPIRAETRKAAE